MDVSSYMNSDLIFFFDSTSRDQALSRLVDLISEKSNLKNKDLFLQAVMDREKIVSTGIGMGIAIPHAKLSCYNHFFIAVGLLKKAVDWNALDEAPVKLIFMIGGPDDKQTEYLQILSRLTQFLRNEDHRQQLLTLRDPAAMLALFRLI